MDYDRIRELHARQPFQPFDIRTTDGRVYTVDRPEYLLQSRRRRWVSFTAPDNHEVTLTVGQIAAVELAGTDQR